MVAAEMKTKDDIWTNIYNIYCEMVSEHVLGTLKEVLHIEEIDPHLVTQMRARDIKFVEQQVYLACQIGGGIDGYYWPRVPYCLRQSRNRQLNLQFDGTNYEQIGADAPFFRVKARQVRKILKLRKAERR